MEKPAFDPSKPFTAVASSDQKPAFDPNQPFQSASVDSAPQPMSAGDAGAVSLESGATLGLRPVVAGAAGAAGNAYGQLTDPMSSLRQGQYGKGLSQVLDAFKEGRSDANAEQTKATKDHPGISLAGNVVGSALTLPFLPAKGLAGAVGLGAGLGAAQAAGSANSLPEAAVDIAGGGALGGAGYGAGKVLGAGAKALASTGIGQKVIGGIAKTASALTGVPDKEIETYATQYDKVKSLLDESGGNIPVAAEIQKDNLQAAVRSTKDNLNQQITQALATSPQQKTIPVNSILDAMGEHGDRLNPHLDAEHIRDIDSLASRISATAENGKISVQDLQQIKQFLSDQAANSFNSSPLGFQVGKEGANAAKAGFMEAKHLMDRFGPPEIQNANRQLFQLHNIEDRINKNLITSGKSDAALMAVGGGAQNRDSLALQRLGQLTGKDFVGDANVLSAANRFNNPAWSPAYGTGKSLLPAVAGTALGATLDSHDRLQGAAIGGGIGAALASPAALKLAINTGRIPVGAISAVARAFGVSDLDSIANVLKMPQAQEILIRSMSDDNQAAAAPKVSTTIKSRSQLKK